MTTGTFDDTLFWPALEAAGMLLEASTILPGCTSPTPFSVAYRRPDVNPLTGMQAADFEIEYQRDDVPGLDEGCEVIIRHERRLAGQTLVEQVLYRVRESPRSDPAHGEDGFFRCAYLTRVTASRF